METENKYKYSKAYYKILNLITSNPNENVFVVRGGQGASKTITIIQLIIQSLLSSTKEATVLSSELSKMKRTVIRDYKKICKDWGVIVSDDEFNKSESKHEYPNESYLDFLGADVSDVGKGFRRDILYINEADKMSIDTAIQFISRAKLTIIDYNPDNWFWGDDYINENNFITLTFEDNEFLPETEVKAILDYKLKGFFNPELPFDELFKPENIKNSYWANKWRVYGLGMIGNLEGVIYDWEIIDNLPEEARLLGGGLDFGYTTDPTAGIKVYKYNNAYIVDEAVYRTEMLNRDIYQALKDFKTTWIADSAEPKSIAELQIMGLIVIPATKGPDSIDYGIQLLQGEEILVTSRSTNVIKEMRLYLWEEDKNGRKTGKPIDRNNHAMDAVRYFALNKFNKGLGKYHFR